MKTVIIGGGASGIAAAIKLKQNDRDMQVVVLEHLDEILKKIYATGNGKCNITNRNAKGCKITKTFFDSLGLIMREESEGRMYPYSCQASTVAAILKQWCEKLNINIVTDCTVKKAERLDGNYYIYTDKGIFDSDFLILAAGGKSQKPLGSDGSGYELAKGFGHRITELSPALVQMKSSSKYCRVLKGVRCKCNVRIENNGKTAGSEYGELLFTDYGISGIVVMNLSKYIHDKALADGKEKSVAVIDLVPEMTEEELDRHYKLFGSYEGILPHKLCSVLAKQAEKAPENMSRYIKNWRLIITGTKGYDFAQITSGGVPENELKEGNESAILPNLYIVGELTDNQFDCGGFNLDYAFSSGIAAANKISEKKYDKN